MSKKLRVLLSAIESDASRSDFSIMPINENLLQSINGSGNTNCSNCGCSGSANNSCSNDSCANTRDSNCNNHM